MTRSPAAASASTEARRTRVARRPAGRACRSPRPPGAVRRPGAPRARHGHPRPRRRDAHVPPGRQRLAPPAARSLLPHRQRHPVPVPAPRLRWPWAGPPAGKRPSVRHHRHTRVRCVPSDATRSRQGQCAARLRRRQPVRPTWPPRPVRARGCEGTASGLPMAWHSLCPGNRPVDQHRRAGANPGRHRGIGAGRVPADRATQDLIDGAAGHRAARPPPGPAGAEWTTGASRWRAAGAHERGIRPLCLPRPYPCGP